MHRVPNYSQTTVANVPVYDLTRPGAQSSKSLSNDEMGPGGVAHGSRTSDFYYTENLPDRFDNPEWFKGYGLKQQHPVFRTTSNDYGSRAPCVHTMPTKYFSPTSDFTKRFGQSGMSRARGLNTETDKSRVPPHVAGHIYY